MHPGLIGGIAGVAIGSIGGIIGTWASIRNTKSRKERSFMIRMSLCFWIFAIGFVAALFLIQSPYRFILWAPYSILFPLGIRYTNKKQQQIRKEQAEKGLQSIEPSS